MDSTTERALHNAGHKLLHEISKNPVATGTAVSGSILAGTATLAGTGGVIGAVATGALGAGATVGSAVAGIATAVGATATTVAVTGAVTAAVTTAAVVATPVVLIGGAIYGVYKFFTD